MTNISPKGEDNVGRKKQIAHIVERKNAKYNVEYGTDGTKSEQIKKGIKGLKTSDSVVDSSYTDNDDSPYGSDEKTKRKRQVKGIKRRMKIVMSPLLGTKCLDSSICGGRAGHEQETDCRRHDWQEVSSLGEAESW